MNHRKLLLRDPSAQELKQVLSLALQALQPGVTLEQVAAVRALVDEKLQSMSAAALNRPVRTAPEVEWYRKKPLMVQAIQLSWDTKDLVAKFVGAGSLDEGKPEFITSGVSDVLGLAIPTLEGVMEAWSTDWIVRGVKGEFYPVKDDIFRETYELPGGEGNAKGG
jgi:hypothetical protein